MIVVGGSTSRDLAKEIASILGCGYIEAATVRFPDGECYTRIEQETLDDDVVIVQNTYPDENLVEMFLLQDAVKNAGAKKITLVIPYFGYARQDRVFKKGEPESAKVMCQLLSRVCDHVITVDLHKENVLEAFGCPYTDVKAANAMGDFFRDKDIDMVFSPDIGAANRAKMVGERMGKPYDHLEKKRLSGTEVVIQPASSDVKGKSVLIVDDMISTGGTIMTATTQLKAAGARKVTVACTHGVYVNNALDRLKKSDIDDLLSCNTLMSETSRIPVAGMIADAIRGQ